MPSCLVIGANGFIGSAIAAGAARHGFTLIAVDTNNYDEHRGTHADLLINAAGNSKKFVDTSKPYGAGNRSTISRRNETVSTRKTSRKRQKGRRFSKTPF